ncbi:MAG: 2-oxoacid:acceptor oxidoreductase family protein [Dehalococcoidia bacterium]|nr:2-oxoacid:acceptor oxidoreductase family protein [Dehalococcoidia bacterium]
MNDITEIRWHGRGGQGAVTSAELLALTAIKEGNIAQAFPSFGPERRGAPVIAFNRISAGKPIRSRAAIAEPDIVVVLDPGLLGIIDVTRGLRDGGVLIVNSSKGLATVNSEIGGPWKLAVVDATAIARDILKRPIVNTAMLGALIKATGVVNLESLTQPLEERFGKLSEINVQACSKAYKEAVVMEYSPGVKKAEKVYPIEKSLSWKELNLGFVVTEMGNARSYRTGYWKSERPVRDNAKCIKCGMCALFCPEDCIHQDAEGYFEADEFYCKGCGICARECWTGAITMVEA